MNIKAVASDIVLAIQDERWQKQEARIAHALGEAYRVGFLDGEDAAKDSQQEMDELRDIEVNPV